MRFTNMKIAAVAIGLGVLGSLPASAAVVPAPSHFSQSSAVINTSAVGAIAPSTRKLVASPVEQVRRRGGRYYHRRSHRSSRWIVPSIIAGTAALIIGGSIAQSRASHNDRWEMCAERYVSFSWSDGTFQPYDGPRRLCPYLER